MGERLPVEAESILPVTTTDRSPISPGISFYDRMSKSRQRADYLSAFSLCFPLEGWILRLTYMQVKGKCPKVRSHTKPLPHQLDLYPATERAFVEFGLLVLASNPVPDCSETIPCDKQISWIILFLYEP